MVVKGLLFRGVNFLNDLIVDNYLGMIGVDPWMVEGPNFTIIKIPWLSEACSEVDNNLMTLGF